MLQNNNCYVHRCTPPMFVFNEAPADNSGAALLFELCSHCHRALLPQSMHVSNSRWTLVVSMCLKKHARSIAACVLVARGRAGFGFALVGPAKNSCVMTTFVSKPRHLSHRTAGFLKNKHCRRATCAKHLLTTPGLLVVAYLPRLA